MSANRAKDLPIDPWSLVFQENGINLLTGALCVAVELIVYGNEKEGDKGFKDYKSSSETPGIFASTYCSWVESSRAKRGEDAQPIDIGADGCRLPRG
mgnify:CR=1 FL=1